MGDWTSVPIGELFESTIAGEWGAPPEQGQSVPVLRSTNITNDGKLDLDDVVLRHIPPKRLWPRRIRKGDILVEKSGGGPQQPAGRVAYCPEDLEGTCSNFLDIAHVGDKYDSKFVFYLLHHLYKSGLVLRYQQQTTGIINFKFREYQAESVRIPVLREEQAAIAEILTTVDQAIEQTEALIAKQRRIKAGLLHDLLTRGIDEHGTLRDPATHQFKESPVGLVPVEWEVTTLSQVVPPGRPIVYGILMPGQGFVGGTPVVKVKDISDDGEIKVADLLLTDPKIDAAYHRSRLRAGDLLFTIRGTVGRMAFVPTALDGANITQDTARISISKANPRFIRYYLEMPISRSFIDLHTLGQAVKGINLEWVRQIPIPLPMADEQERIASCLYLFDQELYGLRMELGKRARLKAGLAHELLTGTVTIR